MSIKITILFEWFLRVNIFIVFSGFTLNPEKFSIYFFSKTVKFPVFPKNFFLAELPDSIEITFLTPLKPFLMGDTGP